MRIAGLASLGLLAGVAIVMQPAQSQPEKRWDVYVDTANCAPTRQSWLAAAQDPPGFGWTPVPGSQIVDTFDEAMAELDGLRATSDRFELYCCKFKVWGNQQSGDVALVREGEVAGFGWMDLGQTPSCAESLISEFGLNDALGATTLDLASVPGTIIAITPQGPVAIGPSVTIPTNPPTVISATPGGFDPGTGDDDGGVLTGGEDGTTGTTGDDDNPPPPPPPTLAGQITGSLKLTCTRIDMPDFTYEAQYALNLKPPGERGDGTLRLDGDGGGLGPLSFTLFTQTQGRNFAAHGEIEPGTEIRKFVADIIGMVSDDGTSVIAGDGGIQMDIAMSARFANGRTPGDGQCIGKF